MSIRYGSETYNIDHKGRVSVPVALRRARGRQSMALTLARGLDGCIVMYTEEQWTDFKARLKGIPYGEREGRDFKRQFFAHTVGPLTPDAQGRITIPAHLLGIAGLTKEVKFLPMDDRIELWDPARWNERQALDDDAMARAVERYFGGSGS
jgi:MraZ protein